MMTFKAFHIEIASWSGIVEEVQEGKHIYLFEGMMPQPLPGEMHAESRKQLAEEELQPIIKKIHKKMSSLKETIINVKVSIGSFPTFAEFQGSSQQDPLITIL